MPIRYSNVVGGSSSTGFNLDVGASGNTTFYFDTPQPAGGYSITSQAADTSIEFYAIAEDGTLAGYTNTKALSATKDFDTLVVYGATTNDLITFEYKSTTLPTASGDQDSGAAPFVTAVSDADLASIEDTTIITGGNFATDVTVTFTGTDAVVRNSKSIVRTNSTQLIVTRPDDFLEDNSPYTLTVSNPGITQSAIITNTSPITAGGDPAWATLSGSLTAGLFNFAYSQTISATDPDGGDISYALVSGQLPSGLSLNLSTGEISGTPDNSLGETQSFIISATDAGGNATNRSFSIEVISEIGTQVSPATSAAQLTSFGFSSGTYWINVGGTPTELYCDLSTNGGGWTSFASAFSAGGWFGGNSGPSAAWLGLSYSYGTYSTSGSIGDYWRNYSGQSPSEVMFMTGNGQYWISFPLSYFAPGTNTYTSNVVTSNNFPSDSNNYNGSVTIMNRANSEDPWVNAGNVHAIGNNYMFWGEAANTSHSNFKNANGGILAFVR